MTKRELDQVRISKILGGVSAPGTRRGFGGFALVGAANEAVLRRPHLLPDLDFSDSDDAVIVKAFEKVRQGMSPDRFLADPRLTKQFNELCGKLGLRRQPVDINRRLLAMRKRTGGGMLKPTTNRDRHPGLIEKYGPAVEFAMTKMSVRFGVTVDDLLASPELGKEFEKIARRIIPRGTAVEYRLCALQIRKAMHVSKLSSADRNLFDEITSTELTAHALDLGPLAKIKHERQVDGAGVLLLREPDRTLYLSQFSSLTKGLHLLTRCNILERFSEENKFWKIDNASVQVEVIRGKDVPDIPVPVCQLRLLADLMPTFNYPLKAA